MKAEYSNDGKDLIKCPVEYEGVFKVKRGTKRIEGGAFENCTKITEVILPDSLTDIYYNAFRHCKSLNKITIPKAVTRIGQYAFLGCYSLKYLRIESEKLDFNLDALAGIVLHKDTILSIECLEVADGVTISQIDSTWNQGYLPPVIKRLNVFGRKDCLTADFLKSSDSETVDFVDACPDNIILSDNHSSCHFKMLKINEPINSVGVERVEALKRLCARYNPPSAELIFAAPKLCDEQSSIPGYIKVTKKYNLSRKEFDRVVDVNTKYICETEPLTIERYTPVEGCRIHFASYNREGFDCIDVYESKEIVDQKITDSLENLSKQVGGAAGLLNELERLLIKEKMDYQQ